MQNNLKSFKLFQNLFHLDSERITSLDVLCCANNPETKAAFVLYTTTENDVYAAAMDWIHENDSVESTLKVRKISKLCGKTFRCLSANHNVNLLITEDRDVFGWNWISGNVITTGMKGIYGESGFTRVMFLDENGDLYWFGEPFRNIQKNGNYHHSPFKLKIDQKVKHFRFFTHGLAVTQNGSVISWGMVIMNYVN
jgi:hypothetical protein